MRVLIFISVLFTSTNLLLQDIEKNVCDCIANNFTQINLDYYQVLEEIEENLISNGIIQKSSRSRIDQIKYVSENGLVEKARSYENIIFEQLGLKTIKYCINLHTYAEASKQPSPYFKLMRDLDILNQNIQRPIDLRTIRKETAKTILKYQDVNDQSQLWKLIQLEYLYLFAETKESPKLIEFDLVNEDTTNTINIDIDSDDVITFENQQISKDQICGSIQNPILKGKGIHLTTERGTKYNLYLEVYNSIKDCIQELRNAKSLELYGKTLENIEEKQKSEIIKIIPMRIVETEPE